MTSWTGPIPVLFTHFGEEWIRGSEILLIDLLQSLDRSRVSPVVWCNGYAMADRVRGVGIPVHRSDFKIYFDYGCPRFNFADWGRLVGEGKALVRRHGIRVLHSNSAAPLQWLLPVARSLRLPLLGHLHIDYLRRSRFVLLQHQADLLVGVSRQVIEDYRRDGMAENKLRVIYNGIDTKRLNSRSGCSVRQELGIPVDAVVVAVVGSLIWRKGQDLLLHALARAKDHPIFAVLIGDGPDRPALTALAESLGLADRVRFTGFLDHVANVLLASDIVCLPSRADAFGLVLAEAGYLELPVVATAIGGIPEVVVHGETGLLTAPEDPSALAEALVRLADSPGLRRRLGLAGHKRVVDIFSVEHMARSFEDAYEELDALPTNRLGWGRLSLGPYLRLAINMARGQKEKSRR